jgi:hypothetical protein
LEGEEVYLFLGSGHTGYHFSYWKYPLIAIGEYFYSPLSPSDQRAISTEMRVTPSGVERHVVEYGEHAGNRECTSRAHAVEAVVEWSHQKSV